jgi:hypothetical protein
VDESGNLLLSNEGVELHPLTLAWALVVMKDGRGGAIVVWEHDDQMYTDVEAQAVDSSGNIRWSADGVMLCDEAYEQRNMTLASDDAGGAFVAWQDARAGSGYYIYAQHVDSAGACMWGEDGTTLCSIVEYSQIDPSLVPDGQGGAIVVWADNRDPDNQNLYANRIQAGTNIGNGGRPPHTRLAQNYPNPFHPVTTISFELSETGPSSLRVHDVRGRLIRTLMDGERAAGP